MTDHSLKGKTVLIAGGAKNLGGLIARDFASQGAKAIVIHYNSAATQADAEATVAAVQAAGGRLIVSPNCDPEVIGAARLEEVKVVEIKCA